MLPGHDGALSDTADPDVIGPTDSSLRINKNPPVIDTAR